MRLYDCPSDDVAVTVATPKASAVPAGLSSPTSPAAFSPFWPLWPTDSSSSGGGSGGALNKMVTTGTKEAQVSAFRCHGRVRGSSGCLDQPLGPQVWFRGEVPPKTLKPSIS